MGHFLVYIIPEQKSPEAPMPMSRKAKIWLTILAIPLVLVIAGIIALKVMFTSDRLKSMVVPRIEETTGRAVAINTISLTVFPSIALKMEGVSMANRQGEGFTSQAFLTLDVLRLNVKLLPLLKSRVEVTSLEVDRPCLLLEVNARNETNYANLTGGRVLPDRRLTKAAGVRSRPPPLSSSRICRSTTDLLTTSTTRTIPLRGCGTCF